MDLPKSQNCFVNGIVQTNDETFIAVPQEVSKLENSSIPLDMSFWHPNYLIAPKVDHPLQNNLLKYIGATCSRHVLGFIIGLTFSFLFCFLFLIIVPLKILFYLITRCTFRGLYGWLFVKNHCDPMWPWGVYETKKGSNQQSDDHISCDNSLLVVTLRGSLETDQLMQMIWRKLFKHAKQFNKEVSKEDDLREHVTLLWSRDESLGLNSLDDLELFLSRLYFEPMNVKKLPWKVYVVTDFGDSDCTLIILKHSTRMSDLHSCPLKLMCVMNDSKLFFVSSPHVVKEAFISHFCVKFTIWFWHFFRILSIGPIELLSNALRTPSLVWTDAKRATAEKPAPSLASKGNFQLTWARLPNTDLLAHAEKVLRISTQEVLTSFVAGSLRRHLKSNGIKHPPALWIDIPLALDERQYTVELEQPCNFTLMPVSLATDIDGAVPRAWETQRRMSKAVESSFWRTCDSATTLCDLLFSKSFVRKLFTSTHASCDGFVGFWRTLSELSISNQKIYSLLVYPSLAKRGLINGDAENRGKFGFTFIQTGRDIMLSLLVDSDYFPDVNGLLNNFQNEFRHLLKHLSSKMTTVTQISIMPQTNSNESANYYGDECDSPTDTTVIITQEEPVEELEYLLVTVQNELEEIKNNPVVDGRQTDYLLKLTRLEERMEAFHGEIVDKLNSINPSNVPYEKQLGETTWYDLLRMYSRSNSKRKNMFEKRKRSKRMSTPSIMTPSLLESKRRRLQVVSEWP